MSAAVLHNYSPALFESLPSVGRAAASFKESGGLHKIETALAAVAQKHPSAVNYGVQLLHRHSGLDQDEIMLAYGPTTVPVKKSELSEASQDNIYATIWGIRPGSNELIPLEFAFADDAAEKLPELDQQLAQDFAYALYQLGLEHTLGLALVKPGQDLGLETTHGRANIVLPAKYLAKSGNLVDVCWPLTTLGPEFTKKCSQSCWTNVSGGHSEIHKVGKYHIFFLARIARRMDSHIWHVLKLNYLDGYSSSAFLNGPATRASRDLAHRFLPERIIPPHSSSTFTFTT
ncbi:hypothetical protein CF335_g375 [Tilletia laevis]|nr:hypothetical protein CF335_g375 [Tilletia laevis]